jgi:hypothetical protein
MGAVHDGLVRKMVVKIIHKDKIFKEKLFSGFID